MIYLEIFSYLTCHIKRINILFSNLDILISLLYLYLNCIHLCLEYIKKIIYVKKYSCEMTLYHKEIILKRLHPYSAYVQLYSCLQKYVFYLHEFRLNKIFYFKSGYKAEIFM